ncbi:MAG: HEAT repeat domain-containing protein [Nitrospirae bacterium]|nr:HEAT repeat domain-containing protein [Nitrospirota bacterium]
MQKIDEKSINYIKKNLLHNLKPKDKSFLIKKLLNSDSKTRTRFIKECLYSSVAEVVGTAMILMEEFFKQIDTKNKIKIMSYLKNKDEWVRERASALLRKFADQSDLPQIEEGLKDKNDLVRSYLTEALGKIKNDRSAHLILTLLKDKSDLVRVSAIETAELLKLKKAIPQLKKSLNDKSFLVREYAISGLYTLCGKKSLPILETRLKKEKTIEVGTELMVALYFCEPKESILNDFIEMLNDRKSFVREASIVSLPRLINKKNRQKIIETLKITIRKESDKGLRKQIRKGLKAIVEKGTGTEYPTARTRRQWLKREETKMH